MPARQDLDVEAAAIVVHAGIDISRLLDCNDTVEEAVLHAVALRVLELRADEREDLARRIRNEVIEGLG